MQEDPAPVETGSASVRTLVDIHALARRLSRSEDESLALIGQRLTSITTQALRAQDPWTYTP